MRTTARAGLLALVTLGWVAAAQADVRLPHLFTDHMVLQRDKEIPVWGWAAAGEQVSVQLGDGAAVPATADASGAWRVTLPAHPAGGPLTLTVTGANTVTVSDVLLGEVWVCSGQSNMEWTVGGVRDAAAEIAAADHPRIRHITVPKRPAGAPMPDFDGAWSVCSPQTVAGYTACGYFFARAVQEALDVPVGIINTSWGGTAIEPWTPPIGFAQVPALQAFSDRAALLDPSSQAHKDALAAYLTTLDSWVSAARDALANNAPIGPVPAVPGDLIAPDGPGTPTGLYNGMVAPLIPYAFRGALWYQGETNHGEGMLYTEKMKALIGGWRALWGQGEFPFYYVQIAPFEYGGEDPSILATFWEAQAAAQSIPNTGMVVINDIAELEDIHPKNKQDVGKRLALWALAKTYGQTGLEYSGPVFRALEKEQGKLRVRFDHAEGLASRDGKPLTWFEVIGPETEWTAAEAAIEGDSVVLSAPGVADPCAMRFAWHRRAEPNLMNGAGLPASAFRAGEVPVVDFLAARVAEASGYKLVYDYDLSKLSATVKPDVDHSADIGRFDRVAYMLDIQKPSEGGRFAYVSMDAFTEDAKQLGIPTFESGIRFQTGVANLNVFSNVKGIVTGEGLAGGNIEFWPCNYGPPNAAGVPNADAGVFDFGDQMDTVAVDGYGCMQIHNHDAGQTVIAVNNFRSGAGADIGIGNSEGNTRDWTFVGNAGSYGVKRLRVLVHPAP